MKNITLIACVAVLLNASAQTTIFTENFEGNSDGFHLNTTGSGPNKWRIDNAYNGNSSGTIPTVPNQPASFQNSFHSHYLHICNETNCQSSPPICNANYDPLSASEWYTDMSTWIGTLNQTNVALGFWYLCGGEAGVSYGRVEYSINNGSTWTAIGPELSEVTTWTHLLLSDPAFNQQPSLIFRFRWTNGSTGGGTSSSLALDEITITSGSFPFEGITTLQLSDTYFCQGEFESIGFQATGAFNTGNIFTAQLSDGNGSFASPITIGTLASTSWGLGFVDGTFSATLTPGNGYRVRIVSSDPVLIGQDNGQNFTIGANPTIAITSTPADGIICSGESATLEATGGTIYFWMPPEGLDTTFQATVIATPAFTTEYIVIAGDQNGCGNSSSFTVTVEDCLGLEENAETFFSVYPNPASEIVTIYWKTATTANVVELLDNSGRLVDKIILQNNMFSVNAYPAGTYFVRIAMDDLYGMFRITKN